MIAATAHKQTKSTPHGVELWASPDRNRIVVVHLNDHCIFSQSDLKLGMQLVSINGKNCLGKSLKEVYRLLDEIEGSVTLIAGRPPVFSTVASSLTKLLPPPGFESFYPVDEEERISAFDTNDGLLGPDFEIDYGYNQEITFSRSNGEDDNAIDNPFDYSDSDSEFLDFYFS